HAARPHSAPIERRGQVPRTRRPPPENWQTASTNTANSAGGAHRSSANAPWPAVARRSSPRTNPMGSAAVRPFLHDSRASPRSGSRSAVTSGPVKRTSVIALGAGLWLLGAVPGALASGATPPQPTDPKASSPAGTVYEIPLDAARGDAAPHRHA